MYLHSLFVHALPSYLVYTSGLDTAFVYVAPSSQVSFRNAYNIRIRNEYVYLI